MTHHKNWFILVSLGRSDTLNGKPMNVLRQYFRMRELYRPVNKTVGHYFKLSEFCGPS